MGEGAVASYDPLYPFFRPVPVALWSMCRELLLEKAEAWETISVTRWRDWAMLVLSRRPRESIRIGPDIQIKCLEVRGNQVKLGICAPNEVVVDREEVYLSKLLRVESELVTPLEVRRV